jgi:3-methyladenine DNA glycosylase AlkC
MHIGMAEALKSVYHGEFLRNFGNLISDVYSGFRTEDFTRDVMDGDWENLELKQRIRRISTVLGRHLPSRYEDAIDILLAVSPRCTGFPYLILPDYVEVYGQADEHWELSMRALEQFTCGSSAEFAVRPFILRQPERMMAQMLAWTEHPSEHVRRLASEGCRPRLPWGVSLPLFKRDPSPILPILERLKQDPSLYVRKSVANNLNDIAKDNPDVVLRTARRWIGHHPHTDWIIRHGLRTMIRRAEPEALALFGFAGTDASAGLIDHAAIRLDRDRLPIGGRCEMAYEVRLTSRSRSPEPVKLRIEYAVDYVRANGRTSRKLFFLTEKSLEDELQLKGQRTLHWADLSTRRHYPGLHRITLLVNGHEAAQTSLELT